MTRDTVQAAEQPHERVRTVRHCGSQPSRRPSTHLSCRHCAAPTAHLHPLLRCVIRRGGCSAAHRRPPGCSPAPLHRCGGRQAGHPHGCAARRKKPVKTPHARTLLTGLLLHGQRDVRGMESGTLHAAEAWHSVPSPPQHAGAARGVSGASRHALRDYGLAQKGVRYVPPSVTRPRLGGTD